jgi:hypothetical protein
MPDEAPGLLRGRGPAADAPSRAVTRIIQWDVVASSSIERGELHPYLRHVEWSKYATLPCVWKGLHARIPCNLHHGYWRGSGRACWGDCIETNGEAVFSGKVILKSDSAGPKRPGSQDHIRLIDTAAISSPFQRGGPQNRVRARIQKNCNRTHQSSWDGGRSMIFRGFGSGT